MHTCTIGCPQNLTVEKVKYRKSTGFGHTFQLLSTIENMPRLKCKTFFTPNFEFKNLFSIAPIAKNGVQSEVGFFFGKNLGGPSNMQST